MTSTIEFPSPAFPGFPAIRLDLLDGWTPVSVADAVLAAVRDVPDGTFRPNVVVTVRRFTEGHRLAASVEALRATVEEAPESAWLDAGFTTIAGHPGYTAEFGYQDARAGTVVQSHRMALVTRPTGVRDLVHFVGSLGPDDAADHLSEVRKILASAQIDE